MSRSRGGTPEEQQRIEYSFRNKWTRSIDPDDLLVSEWFEAGTAIENRYCCYE